MITSYVSSRLLRAFAAGGVAVALLTTLTTPAFANSTEIGAGCRYDPDNDNDGLGVSIDNLPNTAAKQQSVRDAMYFWNRKLDLYGVVAPDLVEASGNQQDVSFAYGYHEPRIQAITFFNCGGDHWTSDPRIEWNLQSNSYNYHDQTQRDAIASHELGHSFGLAHNPSSSCDQNYAGVMWSDAASKGSLCNWRGASIEDARGASRNHRGDDLPNGQY